MSKGRHGGHKPQRTNNTKQWKVACAAADMVEEDEEGAEEDLDGWTVKRKTRDTNTNEQIRGKPRKRWMDCTIKTDINGHIRGRSKKR